MKVEMNSKGAIDKKQLVSAARTKGRTFGLRAAGKSLFQWATHKHGQRVRKGRISQCYGSRRGEDHGQTQNGVVAVDECFTT